MIPRFARTAVAVLPFLLAVGCNNKDDSNPVGTGGNGGGDSIDTDLDIGVSAVGALDFVNEFVSEIDHLAAADFSSITLDLAPPADAPGGPRMPESFPAGLHLGGPGRDEEEVVWSESDQAWILDVEETEISEEGTATLDLYFLVQYRTGNGTPQQLPDRNTASMTVAASFGVDLEASAEGDVFALSMGYDMAMTVGGLPDGPYTVDGGGGLDMALTWGAAGQAPVTGSIDMDWLMDLVVPADGACPSGNVTMDIATSEGDALSFAATYDAPSATADWTLYEAGFPVDTGTEILACGTPAL